MKDYRHIIAGMKSTAWLITEDSLSMIVEIVNKHISGEGFTEEDIAARLEAARTDERNNPRVQIEGGVGVLSVYGPMFPKSNLMTELSGATSLENFRSDLNDLVLNDAVKQIVMDMDTPGGSAFMVSETGRDIRKAREVKPVYAVANTTCASGGLWLASQATKFYASESAIVGSLGVYHVHEDLSAQDEKQGRKITFISAGEFKTAGHSHVALDEKARAYIQETIDETMQDFIQAVADGRGLSVEKVTEFADGKLYNAARAKDIGMIDEVMSLDDVLGELVSSNFQNRATNSVGALARSVNKVHAEFGGELFVSQEEFSDPGDIRDHSELNVDEAAETGSRRDTPPAGEDGTVPDRADTVTKPNPETKGGEEMDEAQLVELRKELGIAEDADASAVIAAVTSLKAEVEPLNDLKARLESKKKFEEEYPEEAQRLQKLEEKDQENFVKSFTASFENARITKKIGEGDDVKDEPTTLGFSGNVLSSIAEMATEFGEGNPTVDTFKGVVDSILCNGIVDYGETGSTVGEDNDDDARVPEKGTTDAREQFAALVESIQKEDELPYRDALMEAAKRNPELAAAWRQPPVKA